MGGVRCPAWLSPFWVGATSHAQGWSLAHGETVEQNWEFTNSAAASTKMMGLGTRASTLEDFFGFHNWRRTVAWRKIFTQRMAENVKEGQIHRDVFEVFDTALRASVPEMVDGWEKWVYQWESRQHKDGTESPFELKEKVMTMQEIRRKLQKAELLRSGEGMEVEQEDTPSTFIIMGLELEEIQRNLAIDIKAVANPKDAQAVEFLKWRTALLKRIQGFRKLQRTAPSGMLKRSGAECGGCSAIHAIGSVGCNKACAVGLAEVEESLWVGEAREALDDLHQGLRTRTMTNRFRLRNCMGQRMLTRGQGILRQVNIKIHKAKIQYCYVRNTLKRLKGDRPWEKELVILEDSDVRALNERALTAEEAAQQQAVHNYEEIAEEGGVAAFRVIAQGEGRHTLSWIWYVARPEDPTEAELVEALCIEWCKAFTRMRRWREDVVLVEQEMRCTIEYGHSAARVWADLRAYAHKQEDRETRTSNQLTSNWTGIRLKGHAYLAGETHASVDIVVPLDDTDGDNGEEGPPDYEDEGDDKILA
ncbi:hypothetical protein C8F01DRAFT_1087988 [Mycena amicta]|nr:hypothetical protein C8F01DRAFT_1087988 [Mycena amicta]